MLKINPLIYEKSPHLTVGYFEILNIIVNPSDQEFWNKFNSEAELIRKDFGNKKASEDEIIAKVRKLYKSWKIDPSRYRPSPERLLRRILKSDDLYKVNNVVDVCNFISVTSRLPIGLYDLKKATGDLEIRFGKEGETYLGITNIEISTQDKLIVSDDVGPCGSPTTDSIRTSITEDTNHFGVVFYAPEGVSKIHLESSMNNYVSELQSMQSQQLEKLNFSIIEN